MFPVSQILVINERLFCHVPEAAPKMIAIKNNHPMVMELNWEPGIFGDRPVIICSLYTQTDRVQFMFQTSDWELLSSAYYAIHFLWGNKLDDLENSLVIPADSWQFYLFLTQCFEEYQKQNLSHQQKKAIFHIITSFFPIEPHTHTERIH